MKNAKHCRYDCFFVELSPPDSTSAFLLDIDIQHAYEEPSSGGGLSIDQVNALATDILESEPKSP
jgi:hypothetical protein